MPFFFSYDGRTNYITTYTTTSRKNLNIRFLLFKSSRRCHCYLDSKKILSCYLNTNRIFH